MNDRIEKGRYTYGEDSLKVYDFGFPDYKIIIGSFVSIAIDVKIFICQGKGHNYRRGTTYPFGINAKDVCPNFNESFVESVESFGYKGDIIIGNDVWIGDCVTIGPGVVIGDGAVVAANSYIIKSIPPYCIYGGNPGKFIKKRFSDEIIEKFLELKWWDLEYDQINKILPMLQSEPTLEMFDEIRKLI